MGEQEGEHDVNTVLGLFTDFLQFPIRLVLNGDSSKQIEWHCKHYVGRGLMKRFESGADLAKEMGISVDELKKTFDDYNAVVKSKKDPFGKKVSPH